MLSRIKARPAEPCRPPLPDGPAAASLLFGARPFSSADCGADAAAGAPPSSVAFFRGERFGFGVRAVG